MAKAKPLNQKNLEALGAEALAALLIELSTGSAAAKRRLRLALAGSAGSGAAAGEIAKRLASIAKAKTYVDWRKVKPLALDLERQHRAIVDLVAPTEPREAFDLLWRLVEIAAPVFARSDDGSGRLLAVFQAAAGDLPALAPAARLEPVGLADRLAEAVKRDEHGLWRELIAPLAASLGEAGLERLRRAMAAWPAEPGLKAAKRHQRERVARHVLQAVADALGDVDGYLAQVEPASRATPLVAAGIARRLLAAGRVGEAWAAVEAVRPGRRERAEPAWEEARIVTLVALGRAQEARAYRWERFAATLDADHLRRHLRELPDFDDVEAEYRAMERALAHPDVHAALAFLVDWPNLDRAGRLVVARAAELDGDRYELLSPAADALDARHPLAATLARRAMIDFTLTRARSARYGHAARHLAECAASAARIADFGDAPDHDLYVQALRAVHGRKAAFWDAV